LSQNNRSYSRLSHAQTDPVLSKENPLNAKTVSLTDQFENKRCPLHAKQLADIRTDRSETERRNNKEAFKAKRRSQNHGSAMVKNQKPHPELKPSPSISRSVKSIIHNQELQREHRRAWNNNKVAEGTKIVSELEQYVEYLGAEAKKAKIITSPAKGKTEASVERECFKLLRRVHERGDKVLSKSQTFRQSVSS